MQERVHAGVDRRESEGFALAEGFDERANKLAGLALPHRDRFAEVTDATLLVAPDVARSQRDMETVTSRGDGGSMVAEGCANPPRLLTLLSLRAAHGTTSQPAGRRASWNLSGEPGEIQPRSHAGGPGDPAAPRR